MCGTRPMRVSIATPRRPDAGLAHLGVHPGYGGYGTPYGGMPSYGAPSSYSHPPPVATPPAGVNTTVFVGGVGPGTTTVRFDFVCVVHVCSGRVVPGSATWRKQRPVSIILWRVLWWRDG